MVGGREKVIGLNKLGERVIQWEPGENYWPGLAWLGLPGAPLGSLLVTANFSATNVQHRYPGVTCIQNFKSLSAGSQEQHSCYKL